MAVFALSTTRLTIEFGFSPVLGQMVKMFDCPRRQGGTMIYKTLPNFFCVLCATCLLLSIAGCGGKTLHTVPVHGKVTWKGQPLTSGDVGFHPQKLAVEGPHRIAVARLDGEGKYTLSTVTHGDGVQP